MNAHTRPRKPILPALALMALLLIASATAHATNYIVGAGCDYTTIAAAITAAEAQVSGSRPVLKIVSNQSYTAQALSISAKSMSLVGGYTNCSLAPGGNATISGGTGAPVIRIRNMPTATQIILSHLIISDGHGSSGGGVDYIGAGAMNIDNTSIIGNTATDGGGIHFGGNGSTTAQLFLHSNTFVTNNTANGGSGGGLRVDGNASVNIDDDQIWFYDNHADSGSGGGLVVVGPAYAHIGSPGYRIASYIGVMYENTALNGGGIAAIAGSQGDASIDILATDPNNPVRIEQNRAYSKGGGAYLIPYIQTQGSGALPVNEATLKMEGALIDDNAAAEGSGIYADTDWTFAYVFEAPAGAQVYMYSGGDCASAGCNSVSNNRAVTLDGQGHDVPTAGSAILMQTDGVLTAKRLVMRGNEGAHAIRVADSLHSPLVLDTCLLAGNAVTAELATFGSASTTINQCTFAGNAIGGSSVMYAETGFSMTNSIITQGALGTLHYVGTGAGRTIDYVMAQETATLSLGGTHLFNADPLFVDAANGDFHLRADSVAIDIAPAGAAGDRDLDNQRRDQDMTNVSNFNGVGVRDLGAYERQPSSCAIGDTIFCNGFDAD